VNYPFSLFHKVTFLYLFCCFILSGEAVGRDVLSREKDGVVKILAIGNSFSQDAIENSLHDLALEKGIKMIVANMYIGGAPLTLHVKNAEENKGAYSFRKTAVDGSKSTRANFSIEAALAEEDWDYISFQQASPLSGQVATIEASLPTLFNYVKARAKNPDVKFVYHQTWAYSQHAIHTGFANYGNDQRKMYESIVHVSQEVKRIAPIDLVVPAGTAIQNARTSFIGDNFDRDGYHLRLPLGRYVAACTWFEQIFGINVVGMKYKPAEISDLERRIAQTAAHFAVEKPFQVTPLKKFKRTPKAPKNLTAALLLDFGGTSHEGSWNPIFTPLAGKSYALKDSLQQLSRVSMETVERFNGKSGGGTNAPQTRYGFPAAVTGTSYFGNTRAMEKSPAYAQATFKLSGLDKKAVYDLTFFSSKMGDSDGVQETLIKLNGDSQSEALLNVTNNVSKVVEMKRVRPDSKGTLTIVVTAGPGNTNPHGMYYLSAMRLAVSN
jgi:hypothetical protein